MTSKHLDVVFGGANINKTPEPGAEYLYISDRVWNAEDGWTTQEIPREQIAHNVTVDENGRIYFNIRGMTGNFTTMYGYSFVRNTKENIAAYREFERVKTRKNALERQCKQMFRNLETLDNRGWGV